MCNFCVRPISLKNQILWILNVFNLFFNVLLFYHFQQCSELVLDSLQDEGTRVINESIPVKVERTSDDRLRVRWENVITGEYGEAVYDTVMLAIGKNDSSDLNLCRM